MELSGGFMKEKGLCAKSDPSCANFDSLILGVEVPNVFRLFEI